MTKKTKNPAPQNALHILDSRRSPSRIFGRVIRADPARRVAIVSSATCACGHEATEHRGDLGCAFCGCTDYDPKDDPRSPDGAVRTAHCFGDARLKNAIRGNAVVGSIVCFTIKP